MFLYKHFLTSTALCGCLLGLTSNAMALDPIVNGDTVTFTGPNQTVSDDLGYGLFYTSGFDATYSGTLTQGFTKLDAGRLLLTGTLDFPHERYGQQMLINGGIVAASADVWGNHGILVQNGGAIEITGGVFTGEINGFDTRSSSLVWACRSVSNSRPVSASRRAMTARSDRERSRIADWRPCRANSEPTVEPWPDASTRAKPTR